ncbi:MAG: DUF58 domain-containing protein [Halobacteriales archaeon]|nr:DUF58 domain-containing protein [Halobacteriales archaeon]
MSEEEDTYPTRRWRGTTALAMFAGGAGVVTDRPLLLLTAAVWIGYAAYPRLTGKPSVEVSVERKLSNTSPTHGDTVEVETTIRNKGGLLADLRFVDGVPPTLSVASGTPKHATSLRPGGSATFSYEIVAKRGRHSFVPATVVARNMSGSVEVDTTAFGETVIECAADIDDVELRKQASQYTGRVLTDEGGSGVEFHGTREYQPGDSISRIDWKRRARSGELITLEFREERSAKVLLVIDARKEAYVASDEDEPSAVTYSVFAADQLFKSLMASRDSVGLAVIGREDVWLPPATGDEHRTRAREILTKHPSLVPSPPRRSTDEEQFRRLRKRLDSSTQVILLSPLADERMVQKARRIDAYGNAVSVVTPDVTAEGSPGRKLAKVERARRLSELRQADIPVVDWDVEVPLAKVLAHTREQWSG